MLLRLVERRVLAHQARQKASRRKFFGHKAKHGAGIRRGARQCQMPQDNAAAHQSLTVQNRRPGLRDHRLYGDAGSLEIVRRV